MQNYTPIRTFWQSRRPLRLTYRHTQAGFTLIELLVVVILMGILATIAAPSWNGFVQQRRASAANDAIFRALQEAQSQAKTRKLSYSVSFRNENDVPQVAVYPDASPPDSYWRDLGDQLALKSGQLILHTNLTGTNAGKDDLEPAVATEKITFDQRGALPTTPKPDIPDETGLIVQVAAPEGRNSTEVIEPTRRCIKVKTLLGSLQVGKNKQCVPDE